MKIVWNSVAPWIGTGYGQQTKLFTPRLRDLGHHVALSTYCGLEGTIGSWEGMTCYPADLSRVNKFALRKYVEMEGGADEVQVITLMDVWPWMHGDFGGGIADYKGLRLAAWCPIDHDPAPLNVLAALHHFDARPIAMSRFGEARLRDAGMDPLYVPHGVDTKVFQPFDNRDEIREFMKLPKDAFVVGVVANNQGVEVPRKSFPQLLQAFSMFLEKHEDAFLYLHTDAFGKNQGLNLIPMVTDVFNIPQDRVRFVDQDRYWLGQIDSARMAGIYNAMDVLLNPSMGEGFGVPIIEAQACGTPVIVTDWTSMPELVGAGWAVDGDPYYRPPSVAFWKIPAIGEIINALEQAYEKRGDQEFRDIARNFALQYDADLITQEYWKPVLEELDRPREVKPLMPNRAMRRQAAKAKS